uniref:C3H1-type domain-containing protein n=1 Tax=Peronospora matthiolae TaxID=2874970 RepID=A0AAV1ULW8_9STRA
MLLSSMDHVGYYAMSKENSFLEFDASPGGSGHDGYALPPDDMSVVSYISEETSPKNGTKSSLYKTELCKRFSEFGNCRYGAKCQFAHGMAELRHVVRHPKYKTTKCKSYWGSGHCPYGSRCRFIHEETEGYAQSPYSPLNHHHHHHRSSSSSSMFLHEKDRFCGLSGGVMDPPQPSVDLSYGGGLYSEQPNPHQLQQLRSHHHQMMPSYPKDSYSLLASLDKSSWGVSGVTPIANQYPDYAGEHYTTSASLEQQSLLGSIGLSRAQQRATPASSDAASSASSPGYPDLQDAIDALMKFSLTQDDDEPIPDPVTSPETTPVQAVRGRCHSSVSSPTLASTSTAATTKNAEFSLQSDELWKDFPAASSAPFTGDDMRTQPWSTGVSLSLDSKSFEGVAAVAGDAKDVSGSSSDDEESPRLSVFERFH